LEWRNKLYNNIKGSRLKTSNDVLNFVLDEFEKLVKPLEEELGINDFYEKNIPNNADVAELKIGNQWLHIETNESDKVKITTCYRIVKGNGDGSVHNGKRHDFYKDNGIFVDKNNRYITPETIDLIFKQAFYNESSVKVLKYE